MNKKRTINIKLIALYNNVCYNFLHLYILFVCKFFFLLEWGMNNIKYKKTIRKKVGDCDKIKQRSFLVRDFFSYDRMNFIISISSLFFSIIALILSYNANSFSKDMSPLNYSYEFIKNDSTNVVPSIKSDVMYNISDIVININNNPGKISNVYIAYVNIDADGEHFVDIRCCKEDIDEGLVINNNLVLKYKYIVERQNAKLSVGFNEFNKKNYGHFFIILKSYSGDYYYNVVHYINDDEPYYSENTGLYFLDTKTDFFNIKEIYDRNKITLLCNEINSKKYINSRIYADEYTNQFENEYKIIKEKIED